MYLSEIINRRPIYLSPQITAGHGVDQRRARHGSATGPSPQGPDLRVSRATLVTSPSTSSVISGTLHGWSHSRDPYELPCVCRVPSLFVEWAPVAWTQRLLGQHARGASTLLPALGHQGAELQYRRGRRSGATSFIFISGGRASGHVGF